jgi:hypothetical protein
VLQMWHTAPNPHNPRVRNTHNSNSGCPQIRVVVSRGQGRAWGIKVQGSKVLVVVCVVQGCRVSAVRGWQGLSVCGMRTAFHGAGSGVCLLKRWDARQGERGVRGEGTPVLPPVSFFCCHRVQPLCFSQGRQSLPAGNV